MGHHVMAPLADRTPPWGHYASIGSMWMNSPAHRAAALLDPIDPLDRDRRPGCVLDLQRLLALRLAQLNSSSGPTVFVFWTGPENSLPYPDLAQGPRGIDAAKCARDWPGSEAPCGRVVPFRPTA